VWNNILRRSWSERFLALEAFVWLAVFSLAIHIFPFRTIVRRCGFHAGDADTSSIESAGALAEKIGWAVEAAGRKLPRQYSCLAQALSGAIMLKHRGIPATLCLGVDQSKSPIRAHAWLLCGGQTLTGAAGRNQFRTVGIFHSL
jgi:hypothetical protein